MKSNKKLICAILVVILIATMLFTLAACGESETTGKTAQHKKALIICTALISGGLYDTSTGESLWDPLSEDVYYQQIMAGGDMVSFVLSLLTDTNTYDLVLKILDYKNDPNNFITDLFLDENGESINPNVRPANTYNTTADGSITFVTDGVTATGYDAYTGTSKVQYGALSAYREQCLDLQERYGDEWDVTVFNYDWRIDNRKNSELLNQFIETNGWEQVVLTSHSMGGPVVAGYISLLYNQYNEEATAEALEADPTVTQDQAFKADCADKAIEKVNEKILAYRAFSPATAGSEQAIYFLDDPVGACYDTINGVVGETLGDIVASIDALKEGLAAIAAPLAQNMTSVMQLLPFQQFMDSEYYDYSEGESCVYVDGEPVTNLYEWYCSRTWAHKSSWVKQTDENGKVLNPYDDLKYGMTTLPEYWASFYLDTDGDGVAETYSPEIANTVYCLGTGYNTQKSVQITTVGTDELSVNKVYYKKSTNGMGYVVTTDPDEADTFEYSYDAKKQIYGEGDVTMPTHACIGGQDINYTKMTTKSNTADAVICNIGGVDIQMNCTKLVSRGKTIVFYDECDHGSVGAEWSLLKYDYYDMVDSLRDKWISDDD